MKKQSRIADGGVSAGGGKTGAPRDRRVSPSAVLVWLLVAGQVGGVFSSTLAAKEFRAAVVKVDITPDKPQMLVGYAARKSTGVHDRIHHRILALDDGTTQFFLVSSEFCVMSPAYYDRVAAVLTRQFGIEPVNFWWTLTHTHSAPEVGPPGLPAAFMKSRYEHQPDSEYTEFAERKLIEGIAEARRQLAPAKLGVGWGFSQANINRRARDVDGRTSLGMNPDGPVDRRIGVLRLDKADGTPLVLVANYAIHGTVLGAANLEISGDAPGVVADYVEQKIGAPLLFVNGAAGNVAPIYSVYANPKLGHLGEFRVLLGDRIIEANRAVAPIVGDVVLRAGAIAVETPKKVGVEWPAELGRYARTNPAGVENVVLPVRFLQINRNIAIWSAPLELFCEISNEIRERSPFAHTFYFGYANGWLGYLLTPEEMKLGGYELSVSPYTAAGAKDLTESVLTYLHGAIR